MKVRLNTDTFNSFLTITTIFFLVSSSLTAGTTGKLSGIVTDASTGEGLAGANIMVAGTVLGASTDETGYYFIININPGTYEVSVAYIGYETNTSSNVRVSVDQTTNLGFQLSTSVIEGSEVNVTAERAIIEPDVTGSKSIGGNFTCYLDNQSATSSAELYEDIVEATTDIQNSFTLLFDIGASTAPYVTIQMPQCHLEVPSHSIEEVISMETNFHALPSNFDSTNEISVFKFVGKALNG